MDPLPGRLPTRTWALAGALLFSAFFGLYLASSPAGLYLDDSGETVTVAAVLGIGHPPGYPLHSLIGRLASLIPFAGIPWRVNLLAALWGALTAAGLGLWALRLQLRAPGAGLGVSLPAAATLALLLAAGPVYWHNALGAKGSIYQLNNLFSLGLLALLSLPQALEKRWLRLFWLGLGASLAHHYMSQLPLLPAYAWLLWRRAGWRKALAPCWLALPGLALYAYLPLRWSRQPALAWGDFGSWQDFWFFFFRLQYAAGEITRSAATSWAQLRHALGLLAHEGSWLLLGLAAYGAWRGRREPMVQAWALGWMASVAAVTFYLNLEPKRLDLMRPYLFPAYLCQALLAAGGLAGLPARAGRPWAAALAALALGLAGLLVAQRWPHQSLARYHYADDNAKALLQALPPRALLLAQGDAIIFPLWHRQRVLGERPDVAVVGLAVLPMDWVRQDLARRHPDLRHPVVRGPVGAESVPRLTQAYLELNGHRPLYAAFNRLDPPLPGWRLLSQGPVWRVLRVNDPLADSPGLRAAAAGRLGAGSLRGFTRRPLDPRTLTLIVGDRAIAHNSLGVAAEEAGAPEEALGHYRQASRLHPENPDFPFNQGNAWHALGRLDQAEAAFRKALSVDPGYVNGWYNLGVTLHQKGQRDQALDAFRQVLRLDPKRDDVRQILQQLGG